MALAEAQARWREEAERSAAAHALALSELQARLRGEADERVAAQARLTEEAREEARAAHARVRGACGRGSCWPFLSSRPACAVQQSPRPFSALVC